MFGYVKIYKPELKVKDYEAYQGVYCSLCKQIGKDYGQLARLTLNYDFTLLALARLSFVKECCGFKDSRCSFNPAKKCRQCINGERELSFAAAAAMIMVYFKLCDDISDSSFLKGLVKRLVRPFFSLKRKKAKKNYPELDEIISGAMKAQAQAEKKSDCTLDAAAHPSAFAMGKLLSFGFEGETAAALERFGYLAGRWVYLADAFDDMKDDEKTVSFNVFNIKDKSEKENREYALGALNLTAAQLTREYEKLMPLRFGDILANIVFDGLYNTVEQIRRRDENEQSVRDSGS